MRKVFKLKNIGKKKLFQSRKGKVKTAPKIKNRFGTFELVSLQYSELQQQIVTLNDP